MISYKYDIQNTVDISKYQKPFNNVVRYAYNRFQENQNLSVDQIVRLAQENMNHIETLDFSLIRYAVVKATSLKDKHNVIFGSRKLFNAIKFFKYKKNPKISLEELKTRYKEKRYNQPIFLRGSCSDSFGNRKAELDIIDNNSVIIKFNKKDHVEVKLPELSKKHKEHLYKLQDLCDKNEGCFSINLTNKYIVIMFEESYVKKENKHKYIENRILSLDLNPNYIGLSVVDWSGKNGEEKKKIIYKEIIDITKITSLKQNSYKKNKRDYETSEINRHIIDLALHYKCELLSFEKLDIEAKDHSRGKRYNKLVNNDWNRTPFIQNLIKRSNLIGLRYIGAFTMYSSFIGQMLNESEYDSIAASIEISRRAYLCNRAIKFKQKPRNIIYPVFDASTLPTLWKKRAEEEDIKSWKGLYLSLKKSKSRYRFLFDSKSFRGISFSLNSCRSLVTVYS
jgi:hypothetical protein